MLQGLKCPALISLGNKNGKNKMYGLQGLKCPALISVGNKNDKNKMYGLKVHLRHLRLYFIDDSFVYSI